MDNDPGLAQRLRAARGKRKAILVAKAVGVHRVTYSKYERGKCGPSGDVLVKLAAELGVTAEWLVLGDVPGGGDATAA